MKGHDVEDCQEAQHSLMVQQDPESDGISFHVISSPVVFLVHCYAAKLA